MIPLVAPLDQPLSDELLAARTTAVLAGKRWTPDLGYGDIGVTDTDHLFVAPSERMSQVLGRTQFFAQKELQTGSQILYTPPSGYRAVLTDITIDAENTSINAKGIIRIRDGAEGQIKASRQLATSGSIQQWHLFKDEPTFLTNIYLEKVAGNLSYTISVNGYLEPVEKSEEWIFPPYTPGVEPDAWRLGIEISSPGQNYAINLPSDTPFNTSINLIVNWGDGTTPETYTTTGLKTHTYATAGRYIVTISGTLTSGWIRLNNPSTAARLKATSVIGGVTGLTNLNYIFQSCTGLTSLPIDLFRYNTNVTNLSCIFQSCTGLTSLPIDLFRYNTNVINLYRCFQSCTGLTSLPIDLFRYNTNVTNLNYTFQSCTGLTSLPIDLFRYNTNVTNLQSCFQSCIGLTSLPIDLFRYNTNVITFESCFQSCTGLTSLPIGLFKYNLAVVHNETEKCFGFRQVFYGCNKLQLNPWIFYTTEEEKLTRFATLFQNFQNCFRLISTFTGIQGTAPELWECIFNPGSPPITTDCFKGHSLTSVSNYADIPEEWK